MSPYERACYRGDVIPERGYSRREFFRLLLVVPFAFAAIARALWPASARAAADRAVTRATPPPAKADATFEPTPDCADSDEPTPPTTEGPFFKPRSPLRTSLVDTAIRGTRLELTGRVFGRSCRPIAGALVDFWQADDSGEYDNVGFRLRGHQFTDAQGRYRLETIVPGLYPGRTRHIHVRVQAPHRPVLTTQLFFPDEARNRRDGIFRSDLLVTDLKRDDSRRSRFHFLLDVA